MTNLLNLRLLGWIEALSFLALLFIAMPLKYMADLPIAVRIVGPIHGVLFIIFAVMIFMCHSDKKIDSKLALRCAVGSLLPFGPLLYHKQLSEPS
jgi:integral membrane protein